MISKGDVNPLVKRHAKEIKVPHARGNELFYGMEGTKSIVSTL